MTDPYTLRTLTSPDEFDGVARLLAAAFGQDMRTDEVDADKWVFEPDRDHVVEDVGEIVANAGAYTRQYSVPGAVIAAGHVTVVGVHPTYRRQGLLTRLMRHQLRDIRDVHREAVAVLWASEGRIYQRFGYGLASVRRGFELDRREVRLVAPPTGAGRLRDASPEQARKELQQVYEAVRPQRPGWSSRDDRWWRWRLHDPQGRRDGATEKRALLYENADGLSGYAIWRIKPGWEDSGPRGEAQVGELVAATPEAYVELWRFLLSIDLTRTVRFWYAAADEPLQYLVNEPRALGGRTGDAHWVRLTDLPAALAARRYAAPVDVVLDVSDALLPENAGRWRLAADSTGATCEPTTDPADLACDVADLGAAYLGHTSLGTLAAAGRVREVRPGALAAASTAFGWYRSPSALDIF